MPRSLSLTHLVKFSRELIGDCVGLFKVGEIFNIFAYVFHWGERALAPEAKVILVAIALIMNRLRHLSPDSSGTAPNACRAPDRAYRKS